MGDLTKPIRGHLQIEQLNVYTYEFATCMISPGGYWPLGRYM